MKTSRKIAIVLWFIQGLAFGGGLVNGEILSYNLGNWIGFLLPGLIGLGLWFGKNNQKKD
jgi:hypothetical protein